PRSSRLSLHDALPIFVGDGGVDPDLWPTGRHVRTQAADATVGLHHRSGIHRLWLVAIDVATDRFPDATRDWRRNDDRHGLCGPRDRKSTRLNSSHVKI